MATYTDSLGFSRGSAAFPAVGITRTTFVAVTLDFVAITAARLAAGATALANGDILQVISLPAKTAVLAAGIDVTTAEGGTLTLDLGDGADPDGFLDGVDGNAVTSYATLDGAGAYAVGRYYAAADTVDLTIVNAADTAVMRVWLIVTDCS